MEALAQEIMYEFVSDTTSTMHSAQTFDDWLHNSVKSKSFQLACTLVFECYAALKCFRCGVRKCNSNMMLAGRQGMAPVMFVGNHAIYRKIIHNDMFIRSMAPPEIATYHSQE